MINLRVGSASCAFLHSLDERSCAGNSCSDMASGADGADAERSETTRLSTNGHFSTIIDAERAKAFHVPDRQFLPPGGVEDHLHLHSSSHSCTRL